MKTIGLILIAASIAWVGYELNRLNGRLETDLVKIEIPQVELPEVKVSFPDKIKVAADHGEFNATVGTRSQVVLGRMMPVEYPLKVKVVD